MCQILLVAISDTCVSKADIAPVHGPVTSPVASEVSYDPSPVVGTKRAGRFLLSVDFSHIVAIQYVTVVVITRLFYAPHDASNAMAVFFIFRIVYICPVTAVTDVCSTLFYIPQDTSCAIILGVPVYGDISVVNGFINCNGILGGTGSSKSTLVQLIPRLYDVTEGSVKVGGVDVREYDLDALRSAVSMVLQKNELFSGSIKENLRWGNENATDAELEDACRLAQADDFIRSFPDGYDTHIEQGGTNVSGGQKQRLCIARALLKKPKILILDDSTSAVDTRTDALIREGFKSYIPETTKIIIAQRVASVQDADLILVMDGGAIAASGTHEELLKTSEIYREVYESQTNGGDENA